MGKKIDMTGWIMKEHGVPNSRLTVIAEDKEYKLQNNKKGIFWKCKCECGNIIIANGTYIRNGDRLSCGCKHNESKRA